MQDADWYFDFVSPFAYLQFAGELPALRREVRIAYRPVLFAGLLRQWGHKGPAEIATKRLFTYRFCTWWAADRGVPFRMPPAHPFNPLPCLRLACASGGDPEVIGAIFDFIWGEGRAPDTPEGWSALCRRLGLSEEEAQARAGTPETKEALKANYDDAVAAGLFGVPTFVAGGELFWGVDATGMLRAWLRDPGLFSRPEMARLADLPASTRRREA